MRRFAAIANRTPTAHRSATDARALALVAMFACAATSLLPSDALAADPAALTQRETMPAGPSASGPGLPNLRDPDFAKAAVLVTLFDRLDGACARERPLTANERAGLDDWSRRNGIERVRARVVALATDPDSQGLYRNLAQTVEAELPPLAAKACVSQLALSRVPDAQLARTMPAMLERLPPASRSYAGPTGVASGAATGGATTARAEASRPSGAASTPGAATHAPATPATLAALQRDIDSFGFDSGTTMGIGGFLTTRIFPIVLFRDGRALLDIEALAQPAALPAHQRANPDDWIRWRRDAGELQLERRGRDGTAWKKLYFQATYPRLPEGFRLEGRFRALSGTGNLAVGGSDSVVAFREYTFARDGRVLRGGGAGASATAGDFSVATASAAPAQRGHYRIDGLLLTLEWDDGSRETRLVVADPQDPKTAIWLDGTGYVQR